MSTSPIWQQPAVGGNIILKAGERAGNVQEHRHRPLPRIGDERLSRRLPARPIIERSKQGSLPGRCEQPWLIRSRCPQRMVERGAGVARPTLPCWSLASAGRIVLSGAAILWKIFELLTLIHDGTIERLKGRGRHGILRARSRDATFGVVDSVYFAGHCGCRQFLYRPFRLRTPHPES